MIECPTSEGWLDSQPEMSFDFDKPFEPDPVNTGVGMGN